MIFNDLEIVYGTSFNTTLVLTDNNGNPLNLSGCNARGEIKFRYSDPTPAATFEVSVVSAPSGIVSVGLTPADTSGLFPSSCIYAIEIYNSGESIVTQVAQGRAFVQPMA